MKEDVILVIKTSNKKAKRVILEVIGEISGAFINEPKEDLVLNIDLESVYLIDILRALFLNKVYSLVTIEEFEEKESSDNTESMSRTEENAEETQNVTKTENKVEFQKKSVLKEKVETLAGKLGQFTNAEIISRLNCNKYQLSRILKDLAEEGKIEKLSVGNWKVLEKEETKEEVKKELLEEVIENDETQEEEEAQEKAEEDTDKVEEEITKETPEDEVENDETQEEEETQEVTEENTEKISEVSIFDNEEYTALLDYIMERDRFSIPRIKRELPEEEISKLHKLIAQMEEKYIREEKDALGYYMVFDKIRVLYYIKKNPNCTFNKIKANMSKMSSEVLSRVLNIAIRNRELQYDKKTGYVVLKM